VDLLEALVADQADIKALAHQDAVEHGRAGIDAGRQFRIDVVDVAAPVRQRIDRRVVDGQRFVAGIALRLADDETPVGADKEGVGHRAAGIDAHHLYV
jgi:hypothetical protein